MTTARWTRRPEGSNWGEYGPDDVLGRLNLVTPEKIRQGIAEVVDAQGYSLSLPLDLPGGNTLNPNRFPPVLRPTRRNGVVNYNCRLDSWTEGATDVMNDDLAVLHLQYSTQWDSLAHAGSLFDVDDDGTEQLVYYNGFRAQHDVRGPSLLADSGFDDLHGRTTSSAGALSISAIAEHGVQGRAVLIDLEAHVGGERTAIGFGELAAIMTADDVVVEPGDIVCFHTGYAEQILRTPERERASVIRSYGAVLDGRDPALLDWITNSGLAAIAADNAMVEGDLPPDHLAGRHAVLSLHEHCLFKLGVHLGELWRLSPLARHLRHSRRSRFLLTAPPLNLPGAVGSPVTPVATV